METEYTLKIELDGDHYNVFIPELGPGVKAAGATEEEAEKNAVLAIDRILTQRYELEHQKAS